MNLSDNYQIKLTTNRFYKNYKLNSEIQNINDACELDRDNIIQSAAIRRLQQKTQVYPLEANAAVRSRLTHSLEVQQIGRTIARNILKKIDLAAFGLLNSEHAFVGLVEQACLLHDVGNPPFGHFGETTICSWLADNLVDFHQQAIKNNKGNSKLFHDILLNDLLFFDGNAQGIRIIHSLQNLNLTLSQIASIIKYTIPAYLCGSQKITTHTYRHKKPGFFYSEKPLINMITDCLAIQSGCRFPLVYIMEAADDIAYCIADLEDALDKNILSIIDLKKYLQEIWQELSTTDYLPNIIKEAWKDESQSAQQIIGKLRSLIVKDLVEYSATYYIKHHADIFHGILDDAIIHGNSNEYHTLETLKKVAQRFVFTSIEKETPEIKGYAALTGLLNIYAPLIKLSRNDFNKLTTTTKNNFIEQRLYRQLPKKYIATYTQAVSSAVTNNFSSAELNDLEWYYRVRLLIDYISGMTDYFVLTEYQKFSAI